MTDPVPQFPDRPPAGLTLWLAPGRRVAVFLPVHCGGEAVLRLLQQVIPPGDGHPLTAADLDPAAWAEVCGGAMQRVLLLRNPVTRALAARAAEAPGQDLAAFLATRAPAAQGAWLQPGRPVFDHVLHHEALADDLAHLYRAVLGVEPPAEIAPPPAPWEAGLAAALPRILDLYAQDFARFGYPADPAFRHCPARRLLRPAADGAGCRLAFNAAPEPHAPEPPAFHAAWADLVAHRYKAGQLAFAAIARQHPGRAGHRAFDAAAFCKLKSRGDEAGAAAFHDRPSFARFAPGAGQVYRAAGALWRGDTEGYWREVARMPGYDAGWFGPWNRGLATRAERQTCARLQTLAAAEPLPAPSEGPPVVLMAADPVYAERHAERALSTLRDCGADAAVLAVVDPPPDLMARLEALATRLGGVDIRAVPALRRDRAWFASLRYLMAPELMRQTGRAVFVFDIDVEFRQSPAAFLAAGGHDPGRIGLRISPRFTYPWQRITVNCLYLPATAAGWRFARHMALFLRMQFSVPGEDDLWWIDQNAALSAELAADPGTLGRLNPAGMLHIPPR
mgnify:CR=1 FL=1